MGELYGSLFPRQPWSLQYELFQRLRTIGKVRHVYLEHLSKPNVDSDHCDFTRKIADIRFQLASPDRSRPATCRKPTVSAGPATRAGQLFVSSSFRLQDVVRDILKESQGRVLFTPLALRSAEDYPYRVGENAIRALRSLAETLWKLCFNGHEKPLNLEQTFTRETGLKLALRESGPTRSNKRMMRARRVQFEGKVYDMIPHLKVPNFPRDLRIHFNPDHERHAIIVGSCGLHLLTAGTRYCR